MEHQDLLDRKTKELQRSHAHEGRLFGFFDAFISNLLKQLLGPSMPCESADEPRPNLFNLPLCKVKTAIVIYIS